MAMKKLLLLALLIIFIVDTAQALPCAQPKSMLAAENLKLTVSRANPEFMLKLASNPTTGYQWMLNYYDKKIVNLVKYHFRFSASNCIGAGGVEMWNFKINPKTTAATTTIKMEYARSWEKKAEKRVIYTVNIKY